MIRISGKRVLTVLAFVMAICVSFQLRLIWSTLSSFSDIVREQLDVENHVKRIQLRELKMNHTTTSTSQIHQIISYNQEILYATLRSSYHYLIRSR